MKLSALLIALCLLLAVALQAPLARAQESSETSAPAESSSEESSAAASEESSEESSDKNTAERTVNSVPSVGGGRVTLVSNRNTLTHIASAPKVVNHYAIEEQERKSTAEAGQKRQDEEGIKKKQEQAEKDAKKKEQDEKNALEQKQKQVAAEANSKKLEEQKTKAAIALAKQKAAAAAELEKTKEAARKKEAAAAAARKKKEAAERRRRNARRRRRRGWRHRRRTNIRLHGWSFYGSSYAWPRVNKVLGRYCVLEGLVRGGPSLVGYLPHHCRPYQGRLILTAHAGRESRFDVLPDGRMYSITGRSANWISLNQITFDTHRVRGLHLHGWHNYGYGYRTTSRSRQGGVCMVSGLIRHGGWGLLAHAGHDCRPVRRVIFSANNHHHITRVDVRHDAWAVYSGGYRNHHWVSLDGIIYTPGWGGSHLPLYNGWHHYNHGYRQARYERRGRLCLLSGLIRAHRGWHGHITTLPGGCRPHRRLIFGANVHEYNARIDILPNGGVYYINRAGRHGWISLSNIHFVARR